MGDLGCRESEETKKQRNEEGKEAEVKKGRDVEFITYGSWECHDDRGG